jgi:hypothetical protein
LELSSNEMKSNSVKNKCELTLGNIFENLFILYEDAVVFGNYLFLQLFNIYDVGNNNEQEY